MPVICTHRFHNTRKWYGGEVFFSKKSAAMQLVMIKSDIPFSQRREAGTMIPWSTLSFRHSLQWNKGELLSFNLLMFTFKIRAMLPISQGLKTWIKPRSAGASRGWLLLLGMTKLSWIFSSPCSWLLGPSLLQPWHMHPRRVPLQPRLGWQQLWNPENDVLWPVLWPWHLPAREWCLHLWPQLDRSRLL